MWKLIKKIFSNSSNSKRVRLELLCTIKTNKSIYNIYNTETIENDTVNIEIEQIHNNKHKIILEDYLFNDSWGSLGGVAFNSLIHQAKGHLHWFIEDNKEQIISERDHYKND